MDNGEATVSRFVVLNSRRRGATFTYGHTRGFTLLESLVVLSIFTMLGGLGLIVSLDSYRGYAFRGERDTIVRVLAKARSQSLSNVCIGATCTDGKPHGVRIATGGYTIFQGASYDARESGVDELIASQSSGVSISGGAPIDVVFAQLSADVALPQSIMLVDDAGHSSAISVSAVGRISWSN